VYTRRLSELRSADAADFGGKSASLGELIANHIPVPPGFALSADAYRRFLAEAGLDPGAAADAIVSALGERGLPGAVRDEVVAAYEVLGDDEAVAVRSSAIGEDSAEATFAGQQETYLWVRGADAVCEAVRDCWASLHGDAATSYRARLGAGGEAPAMGVAVQVMVDTAVSGVMFTCNPVSGDPSTVAVNASWGLGAAVVAGEVTPDEYRVSKVTGELLHHAVGTKDVEYVPGESGGTERVDVPEERRAERCLDDAQLAALVDLGRRAERHFGCHQDVEWAIARDGELFLLQSRPVTAKPAKPAMPARSAMELVMSTFGARREEAQ
jgi:phosphoenolpyruvate synthase/pyruvate phosphate dikinase